MTSDTLLYVMTAAIVVGAVAILVQTFLVLGVYRASRAVRGQVAALTPKIEPVIRKSEALIEKVEPMTGVVQQLIEDTRAHVGELSVKAADLMELSRRQVARVDEVLGEATARTRVQMDRIEMVIDDTVNRFQETTTLLQSGIARPIRQLHGLTTGIRTAVSVLFSTRRPTVEQATHDEEMFI